MKKQKTSLRLHNAKSVYQIETNIDDMNPQIFSALMDKLFQRGALDVFWTAVQMKSNRPGVMVTVICGKNKLEEMINVLFEETTTFGIRYWPVERKTLERSFKQINTQYGKINVKLGKYKGKVYTETPEFSDCLRSAKKHKVPVKKIIKETEKNM